MMLRSSLALSLLAVACSRTPSAAPDAAPPLAAADAAVATKDASADSATSSRDASAPSAADRAAALKALAEGRTHSRAKEWPAALAAFDRALTRTPDDPRVLSEVGWAALQANDLSRAEAANKRALASTRDPKLRAAILYNTGRVAEARGNKDAAAKAYKESLALRENAEVKKRLAGVGASTASSDTPAVPCDATYADANALCACLVSHKDDIMSGLDDAPGCKRAASTPSLGDPRLSVVEWGGDMGERVHILVSKDAGKVRAVADLGRDYEPGAFGVHNSATVKGGAARVVNGHTVVVVRSEQDDNDFNMAGLELCDHHAKLETICALGDTTKCVQVPTEIDAGCGVGVEVDPKELDDETRQAVAEIKKNANRSRARTAWTLGDDGKVTVRVLEGDRDLVPGPVFSPRPLW